ncbi:MAG: 50S ribosomal protein L24 [Candidatus Pacebacteria bacterium]|nr:50S ribosomal protein L24 [Candidatus Paceibacterota bacterium]
MKIKKGDIVKMLTGKDRGKTGKIIKVDSSSHRAVVEGLNLLKKNKRPKRQGEKGEIISIPRAVDISNLAFLCPNCKKASRIGYVLENRNNKNKKIRICKKCQARIE